MCIAHIEVTDTFAGEANYYWVRRAQMECEGLSDLQVVRRLKKLVELNGVKCDTENYGDGMRLDVRGACIVAFINFEV